MGPYQRIKYAYTDDSSALKAAVRQLGTPFDFSTPGRPKTTGVAERQVKEVIFGTRTLLRQAGLPDSVWPYAMRAFCFGRNIKITRKTGISPYYRRHGRELNGNRILCGARIEFHPSPTAKNRWWKKGAWSSVATAPLVYFGLQDPVWWKMERGGALLFTEGYGENKPQVRL